MKKKFLLGALVIVIALPVILVVATPKPELEPPLPVPNGYDDFVAAGALINPNPPDWWSMTGDELHEALRPLTASNQAALDLVRTGLVKECRMPPWKANETNFPHVSELMHAKQIAQAFSAEGKLALLAGQTNAAAKTASDCIRFGNEWVRGGVLIDGMVGVAIKNIGLSDLGMAVQGMDVETARKVIAALERVELRGESGDVVLKREQQWALRGQFGSVGAIQYIRYQIQHVLDRKDRARTRQRFLAVETDIRRMKIRLAAHAYALDHGKPPASVHELVPQYLNSLPLDPETGKELPLN